MDARVGDGVDDGDAQAVDDVDDADDGAAVISRDEVAALAADGVRIDRHRFRTDLDQVLGQDLRPVLAAYRRRRRLPRRVTAGQPTGAALDEQREDGNDVDDAHRERVEASTEQAITEHAEVLKRLRDDGGNDADDVDADDVDAGTPNP